MTSEVAAAGTWCRAAAELQHPLREWAAGCDAGPAEWVSWAADLPACEAAELPAGAGAAEGPGADLAEFPKEA
jgi:hypothetical protein